MASWLGSVGVAGSLRDMLSALFLRNIVVADVDIGFAVVDIVVEVVASASALLAAAVAVAAAAAVGSAAAAAGAGDIGAAAGVGAAAVPAGAATGVGAAAAPAAGVVAACAAGSLVVAAAVGAAAAADDAAAAATVAADTAVTPVAVAPAAPAVALAVAAAAFAEVALAAAAMMVLALMSYPMVACILSAQRVPSPISLGNLCMLRMMACVGVLMWNFRPIGHPLPQCLLAYLHPTNMGLRSSALKPCARKGYECAVCVHASNPPSPMDWDVLEYMCPLAAIKAAFCQSQYFGIFGSLPLSLSMRSSNL